jgi:hypothetical protein
MMSVQVQPEAPLHAAVEPCTVQARPVQQATEAEQPCP